MGETDDEWLCLASKGFSKHKRPTQRLLTVDKALLLWGDDADQVRVEVPAALLCVQPRLSLKEVQVTAALEFGPALFALLLICQQPHPQG